MRIFLAGVVVMTAATGIGRAESASQVSTFVVQEAEHSAPLLRIEERHSQVGADVVQERRYLHLKNAVAGSETVRLRGAAQQLAAYEFEDLGSGERVELKVDGDKATAQYRPAKDAEVKSKELPWGPNAVTGNLLPALITKQWATLDAGKTIDCDLFVPFRLETIGFRVQRTAKSDSDKTVTITADASNWLIRQFAPAIHFVYSTETPPRLLRYQGPAPVKIDGETVNSVVIDFRTSPLAAR
jgi:hypothetical protein